MAFGQIGGGVRVGVHSRAVTAGAVGGGQPEAPRPETPDNRGEEEEDEDADLSQEENKFARRQQINENEIHRRKNLISRRIITQHTCWHTRNMGKQSDT